MSDKQIVLLFIKAPVTGQVKTRLAAVVGERAALDLYKSFILDIIETVEKSGYTFRICIYPPEGKKRVSEWLGPQYQYVSQAGDDLGAKMENAFTQAFSEGFGNAILIGSDSPDLPHAVLQEAFASLRENDAVIGPAVDGGYYLIGFKRAAFLPRIFHGIAWSTNTVFRETMSRLSAALLRVHLLPEWKDVDTLDDLRSLFERNKSTAFHTSRTMTYLMTRRGRFFS